MMFSTKAEYGVRVMAHLARHDGGGDPMPISLGSIADAEGLPLAYLEHLVQRLRRAGLVDSRRGAHGGYSLARAAERISMAEVVEALEGEIAPIECISAGADGQLVCVREGQPGHDPCPTKLLWTRVQGSIVRTLKDMTLADLAAPAKDPRRSRPAGGRRQAGRAEPQEKPTTPEAKRPPPQEKLATPEAKRPRPQEKLATR